MLEAYSKNKQKLFYRVPKILEGNKSKDVKNANKKARIIQTETTEI